MDTNDDSIEDSEIQEINQNYNSNVKYGSQEMDEYLKIQFETNKIKPIQNLLDFSKKIFCQTIYKGKDGPINIGMTISMAISKDSTLIQCLAGWNLTLVIMKQKKNKDISEDDQNIILNKLKEDVIKKFPLIEYYIDYYFHTHPNAPWNKNKFLKTL